MSYSDLTSMKWIKPFNFYKLIFLYTDNSLQKCFKTFGMKFLKIFLISKENVTVDDGVLIYRKVSIHVRLLESPYPSALRFPSPKLILFLNIVLF